MTVGSQQQRGTCHVQADKVTANPLTPQTAGPLKTRRTTTGTPVENCLLIQERSFETIILDHK